MEFFNKYGTVLISFLSGIVSVVMVLAVFNTSDLGGPIADFAQVGLSQEVNADQSRVDYEVPSLRIDVVNDILEYQQSFNYKDYITVSIDGVSKPEYKEYVTMLGDVNTSNGETSQSVTFVLNWGGESISRNATFYVRGKLTS